MRHEGIFMLFVAVKRAKCLLLVVVICLVIHVLHGKGKYRLDKNLFSPFFTVVALCKLYPGKHDLYNNKLYRCYISFA